MDRRSFLKFSGAGLALAVLPKAVTAALPSVEGDYFLEGSSVLKPLSEYEGIQLLHQEYGIHIDAKGMTLQELYSYCKEQYQTSEGLGRYPFPMTAITPEYMEMSNGWKIGNGHRNIEKGSLRLNDDETLMGMMSLGPEPGAFDGAIDKQDFFGKVGDDVQPLGKYPFNQGIVVTNDAPLSQLEIVDAQGRVWANASNFGISDGYRCGPIYYPIFEPKGYHLDFVDGGQDYVDEITFWMNRGNSKAEAYALCYPNDYEPPPHNFGRKYDGPPIRRNT